MTWDDGRVVLLDQTRLPDAEQAVVCSTVDELIDAIRRLVVRGAPALGVAGAYGVALAAYLHPGDDDALRAAAADVAAARPTAVNLSAGAKRALAAALAGPDRARGALAAAHDLAAEDRAASDAMARHGAGLVPPDGKVLTHCNTGALVSAGAGTAFAVIAAAHAQGRLAHLWVDETRPLLQGSRLTAWEAARAGIPHSVLPDSAAASLFAAGEVDVVIVGADRICADASVANKVGTYGLAVLARAHDVPFVVVAPTTTIDLATPTGADVEIEQRSASEVTSYAGVALAPAGTAAYNPAFDVTPAHLISALVTEQGVLNAPDRPALRALGQAQ